MRSHLTTVQNALVETLRVVACASLRDGIDEGEEVARFPAGTDLGAVRRFMVAEAIAARGVPFSADVYTHKGLWERFLTIEYAPGMVVEPDTGIITNGRAADTESDAARIARERAAFEHERAGREARHRRAARAAERYEKSGAQH